MKGNGKKLITAMLMIMLLVPALSGCAAENAETTVAESTEEAPVMSEDNQTAEATPEDEKAAEAAEEEVAEPGGLKEVVVYFPNWNLEDKKGMEGGEVASIPWEQVTYINHAFWEITPDDGTTETSFERRDNEELPRTQFTIASTEPEMDYLDQTPSEADPTMARNHFTEYEVYSQKYPDVNVMISIGGWTRCGYFSEMAYTPEGRKSFVQSCLDLMNQYAWIDGIDLDWEYPAGNPEGERMPEDENDEGCPIWGTPEEDNWNFALLLKELREAMDVEFGTGVKKLTACASASYGWSLPCQDWVAAEPHLDMINIMTYDFAGTWAGVTSHNSSMTDVRGAVNFLMGKDIPAEKLNIGSPLYGVELKMMGTKFSTVLGAPIEPERPSTIEISQKEISQFKKEAVSGYTVKEEDGKWVMDSEFTSEETGWHFTYDKDGQAPYLYNDDESSDYYGWFISYEDELSLQAKLDYIHKFNLGGIIVWESSEDTVDHQFVTQMGTNLLH